MYLSDEKSQQWRTAPRLTTALLVALTVSLPAAAEKGSSQGEVVGLGENVKEISCGDHSKSADDLIEICAKNTACKTRRELLDIPFSFKVVEAKDDHVQVLVGNETCRTPRDRLVIFGARNSTAASDDEPVVCKDHGGLGARHCKRESLSN